MANNPVKITDTTLRDGHQSLLATRLRIEDMEPIATDLDSVGFYAMEVWGGATFDSTTRFLAEDPWERLRTFKKLIPNTPLMMLLRGQSLVGYRAYADDVVDAFVQNTADAGLDIFRVFDALNDPRNVQRAADAVKKSGKHLQIVICYSVTEGGKMGGPIFNLDYYKEKAALWRDMGADSICLKDMAGLLAPYDAYELISALKPVAQVPIELHTHYTSGMASMTVLKAIEAGVDIVDTSLAPLALRTSQPAVEPLVMTLRDSERDTGLDLEKLLKAGDYLESMLPKYRHMMESPRAAVIDAKVLSHQIPGGMASNMISQLREADAIDRLDEVLAEIPQTRKDLGYPPLVTPMSQMVGTQSVTNVLFGRYNMISGQVKDYAYGLYGKAPVSPDPELVKKALADYERGQEPYTGRPADLLEPELEKAREDIKDISTDLDDVLTYALYPTTGMKFIRIKHGLDPIPDEMKPKTLEQVMQEKEAKAHPAAKVPPQSPAARLFNVYVGQESFQVAVDPMDSSTTAAAVAAPVVEAAPVGAEPGQATILAPMPGIVLRYVAEVGQSVKEGDPVVVVEAMKMENTLPSPVSGKITSLPLEPGTSVAKDDILAIISP